MALRTPAYNDARTYPFAWLRALLETACQEGVVGPGDLKVSAAVAGLQRVDIAAGTAVVKGDSGVPGTGLSQGLYLIVNDAAVANAVTLDPSHATLPRVDQIIVRVRDTVALGSAGDDAQFDKVTGTPTSGATLDNRNGAVTVLPNDAIRLADVLVPAASSATSAPNIRDRRSWARGARARYLSISDTLGAIPTTMTELVASRVRMECSGTGPILAVVRAMGTQTSSLGGLGAVWMDGVLLGGAAGGGSILSGVAGSSSPIIATLALEPPAAGSHLFSLAFANGSGTGTFSVTGSATWPIELALFEQVGGYTPNT